MNEEQIRKIIRQELGWLIKSDRLTLPKDIELLNGRNIITSNVDGSSFGNSADSKIGFYGNTTTQHSAISDPPAMSGSYVQSEQVKQNDAIKSILDVLQALGLIAT